MLLVLALEQMENNFITKCEPITKTLWIPFGYGIHGFILLHEKLLQFDWLRAVVFQLNLKYLHVKITNLLWVVV